MTSDEELIRLAREQSPADFTPAQLDDLRQRLPHNAELRALLWEHLRLETGLVGTFSPFELSVETILQRAAATTTAEKHGTRWLWLIGISAVILIAVGLVALNRPKPLQPVAVAPENEAPSEQPAAEELPSAETAVASTAANPTTPTETPTPSETPTAVAAATPNPTTPKKPPSAPTNPWDEAFAEERPPLAPLAENLLAGYHASGHDQLTDAEFRRWLEAVPGQTFAVQQDGTAQRQLIRFNGVAKLRAPWVKDAVLRLTPFEMNDFALHLWNGEEGVQLRFYQQRNPQVWAAFRITREGQGVQPKTLALLTTDSGRYQRANFSTLEVRHQNGQLLLTRGPICLLVVPMDEPPREVYLHGQTRLRGISMYRGQPFPLMAGNPRPLVLPTTKPAELSWTADSVQRGELIRNDDGSVTFRADSPEQPTAAILSLDKPGLYEVIAQIEAADPGMGLFVGDQHGKPTARIAVFKEQRNGLLTFGLLRPGEDRAESDYAANQTAPPYLGRTQWLRFVVGLGVMPLWTSGDGRHWGYAPEGVLRDVRSDWQTLGLYARKGPGQRSIRLRHIEIRELSAVTSQAKAEWLTQVPELQPDETRDFGTWAARMLRAIPADADLHDWLMTCAVRTIQRGVEKPLGTQLLQSILTERLSREWALDEKLRLLDEAAMLLDLWDDAAARAFAARYEQLGFELLSEGDSEPFEKVHTALVESPVWTHLPLHEAFDRLNRSVLLTAAFSANWPALLARSLRTEFWNDPPHPDQRWRNQELERLVSWTAGLAAENLPRQAELAGTVLPMEWRHPLTLQLSKEGYNLMAELQAALTSRAYEDAGRIISTAADTESPGLLPDPRDRNLFVSLPIFLATAMQDHPEFREVMARVFGPAGQVRVRQAIAEANVPAVEAATLQFFGTPPAAEAHLWLGDREFSAGRMLAAMEHFRQAAESAGPSLKPVLSARLRLVAGLSGNEIGSSTPADVQLGTLHVTAQEFNQLVSDLKSRRGETRASYTRPINSGSVLAPGRYDVSPKSVMEGDAGRNPSRGEWKEIDWGAPQLAFAQDEQRVYVSNRFQVTAYDRDTAEQAWSRPLGGEQGEAHAWPLMPMRPVLSGDRLYVRRLTQRGIELACLDRHSGELKWRHSLLGNVLSDPMLADDKLFAVTSMPLDQDLLQIAVTYFDAETGKPLSEQPLLRLRNVWNGQVPCSATMVGSRVVCTVGGTTVCFHALGTVHWIRRDQWMPPEVERRRSEEIVESPLVIGQHVFVTQPGLKAVLCLDLESGRALWERPLPELQRMFGRSRELLIVETANQLLGLDAGSGQPVWEHESGARLDGWQLSDDLLLYVRRLQQKGSRDRPCLVWLDPRDGQEIATCPLPKLDERDPRLGPFVAVGDKVWAFSGRDPNQPRREILELIRSDADTPGPLTATQLAAWSQPEGQILRSELATALPGWALLADQKELASGLRDELRGEQQVLQTRVKGGETVLFLQRIDVPRVAHPKLVARVGQISGQRWSLTLGIDGRQVEQQVIEDASTAEGWKDLTIDLQPYAGRTVWLTAGQHSVENRSTDALWKRLEVVAE